MLQTPRFSGIFLYFKNGFQRKRRKKYSIMMVYLTSAFSPYVKKYRTEKDSCRSIDPEYFFLKSIPKDIAKFTGKHLPATSKKCFIAGVSCEFVTFFRMLFLLNICKRLLLPMLVSTPSSFLFNTCLFFYFRNFFFCRFFNLNSACMWGTTEITDSF